MSTSYSPEQQRRTERRGAHQSKRVPASASSAAPRSGSDCDCDSDCDSDSDIGGGNSPSRYAAPLDDEDAMKDWIKDKLEKYYALTWKCQGADSESYDDYVIMLSNNTPNCCRANQLESMCY